MFNAQVSSFGGPIAWTPLTYRLVLFSQYKF